MKTILYSDPWSHLITDSAFTKKEWKTLLDYIDEIGPSEVLPQANMCTKVLTEENDLKFDKQIYTLLYGKIFKLYEEHYTSLSEEPLDETLLTGFMEFKFLGAGFAYDNIHIDIPAKKMSSILYVSPEETKNENVSNLGTLLYANQGKESLHSTVPWQTNRILTFAPTPGVTWHDYANPGTRTRVTVNIMLVYKNV